MSIRSPFAVRRGDAGPGVMVAGFGLDEAQLPVPPSITLPEYDECCVAAGLTFVDRFATWDADPYDGGGYAVSVHRR